MTSVTQARVTPLVWNKANVHTDVGRSFPCEVHAGRLRDSFRDSRGLALHKLVKYCVYSSYILASAPCRDTRRRALFEEDGTKDLGLVLTHAPVVSALPVACVRWPTVACFFSRTDGRCSHPPHTFVLPLSSGIGAALEVYVGWLFTREMPTSPSMLQHCLVL